jgi:hypothetical protein
LLVPYHWSGKTRSAWQHPEGKPVMFPVTMGQTTVPSGQVFGQVSRPATARHAHVPLLQKKPLRTHRRAGRDHPHNIGRRAGMSHRGTAPDRPGKAASDPLAACDDPCPFLCPCPCPRSASYSPPPDADVAPSRGAALTSPRSPRHGRGARPRWRGRFPPKAARACGGPPHPSRPIASGCRRGSPPLFGSPCPLGSAPPARRGR